MPAHPELLEIIVGGRSLPMWTQFMEVVRKVISLTGEEEDFLFALRYCSGRERSMPAADVIRHAWSVERAVRREGANILQDLESRFPGYPPSEILSDWLLALAALRDEAASASTLRWIAPITEEETEKARRHFAALLKALDEGKVVDE
jgi:hypothetical protein